MGQYSIGVVTFTDDTTPTHVKLTAVDFPTNPEISDDGSGGLDAEGLALTGFAPVATLTTKALATLLDTVGLYGICVQPTSSLVEVDVLARKLETCKDPLDATPHMEYNVDRGLLLLGSLTASRTDDATLTSILHTFTDGTNGPVAETDGVAWPTPQVQQRYRLGLCKLAGVQFPEIEEVSIEFDLAITEKTPALGSIWPDSAGVLSARPVITVRGRDLSRVKTGLIELGANAATHANTVIQLIKLANSGSFEDFGSSLHTTITADGLLVPENLYSGSSGSRVTNQLRLPVRFDGTNAPLVFDTTAVYTASP